MIAAMSAPADFRLHHSNSLQALALALALTLRTPAPGQPLLVPEVVLIPQAAMRRWLQAELARVHGIAANLEFLTPGEFVRRALDANLPGADEELDLAGLHWRLYALLTDPEALRAPGLAPLRSALAGADPLKPWALAGELALVFERYQAWRRDWLLAWEAGETPRDPQLAFQAALWRRLAAGRRHRARRVADYLHRFGADGPQTPAGLPSRLFAFATLNVSPDVLRVIASQARVGTLHFYLPTPSRKYWGDLRSFAERMREGEDPLETDENPLLAAWGYAGRDFMAVLGGYEVVHPTDESEYYADPEDQPGDDPDEDTLLGRLQRDLLHRRAPQPWREAVEPGDVSLQLHACHTRLREVQVLHDRLQALLDDPRFDPPLQPREIAVLAPDLDPYLPAIAAVFGAARGQPGEIPYTLADASVLASEPLAEVALRLLALPLSRFGLHEVLDLLATPAIAEAAGLTPEARDRLHDWLQAAGARWGLDATHRARHDAPAEEACTWRFALERLLLGHATGAEADLAGVAPLPLLEGGALDALDALLRLLEVLATHERTLGAALTPAQWRERVLALLEALLPRPPRDPRDARTLERLRELFDGFARQAQAAGFDRALPPEVVRAHLRAVLAEADTRAPLLGGGVSFARMVPMRLLPFRVICVLGLNDGEFPRRDPGSGLNRLTQTLGTRERRAGDRSLRDDDRFLFLQLFAAAGEVFYVSWCGADPRDGSERLPSTVVTELLEAAARYHHAPETARTALVLHHPLQPFAPDAFGDGRDPRRFSYGTAWQAAAHAGPQPRRALPAFAAAPLVPSAVAPEPLSAQALAGFLCDMPGAFLRQRLGMRLPEAVAALDDTEPLQLPAHGLLRHAAQRLVFEALCAGEDDVASLHARLCARALLPPGPSGRRQAGLLRAEMLPYARAFRQWCGDEEPVTARCEAWFGPWHVQATFDGLYRQGLVRLRFGALDGVAQIRHGLDWLLLCATAQPVTLWQLAAFEHGVALQPRAPVPAAQAREALQTLLALCAAGLREPLPFLPRSGWTWYAAMQDTRGDPDQVAQRAWEAARKTWRQDRGWSEGDEPGARLALRGRDPFADAAQGARFRALARTVFDAVLQAQATELPA